MKTHQICPYPSVACSIEFIDQDTAQKLLATNPDHQRKAARQNIEKIANDMINSRFHLTGEPVIIGKSGALLDGQHRLLACLNSKRSFWTVIVRGVDDELFHLINIGKSRTLKDILTIQGEKSVTALAATLLRMAEYIKSAQLLGGSGSAISVSEALDTLTMNPKLRDSVKACYAGDGIVSPSRIAWLHCVAHENCPEKAADFFHLLFTGENLSAKHPAYLLRARLVSDRMSKARLPLREVLAIIVKAWNAHVRNETPKVLKWSVAEAFPEVQF